MKRKNYMFKFGISICFSVLFPMFTVMYILFSFLLKSESDDGFGDFELLMLLVYAFLISIVLFTILGFFVFKKCGLKFDDDYITLNKIKLSKYNISSIYIGRILFIYHLKFSPIKYDKTLVNFSGYFYSLDEINYFLTKYHYIDFLDGKSKITLNTYVYNKGFKMGEDGIKHAVFYKCPCCEMYTYKEAPNDTHFICPVCFFEDDKRSIEDPNYISEYNGISLNEAKKNYLEFKAIKKDLIPYVREPLSHEMHKLDE